MPKLCAYLRFEGARHKPLSDPLLATAPSPAAPMFRHSRNSKAARRAADHFTTNCLSDPPPIRRLSYESTNDKLTEESGVCDVIVESWMKAIAKSLPW